MVNILHTDTNAYALSYNRKCVCYLPDRLLDLVQNKGLESETLLDSEKDYYLAKYKYLKKHGVIDEDVMLQPVVIYTSQIEHAFYNTPEIVFEVTEGCNMCCAYCVYGSMYHNSDNRDGKSLNSENMIKAIKEILEKRDPLSRLLHVGFYGGEPLLRFNEIKRTVLEIESCHRNFKINWLMTTNGTLLDPDIIQFLSDHEFQLLISLDGSQELNRFRVFADGSPTHDKVLEKIRYLKEKFPKYYKEKVSFSSVNASFSNVEEINDYFETAFDKTPVISNLTTLGADDKFLEKIETQSKSSSEISDQEVINLLEHITLNVFPTISSLIESSKYKCDNEVRFIKPSGVCFPF